jgi:hypothetical protein
MLWQMSYNDYKIFINHFVTSYLYFISIYKSGQEMSMTHSCLGELCGTFHFDSLQTNIMIKNYIINYSNS